MKTSFKAVRAALVAVFVFMVGFAAEAQRIQLKQLERYLGQPIPNRAGYVGLTDTLGDQYYHKLDSIIGYIADSISQGLDTDEQYFDTAMIVNDTLILSIIRDNRPAHRISLTAYTTDDQTLSYDHASNTLSISGGNSVTNFEQAWIRQADELHPISYSESILRRGYTTIGWDGTSDSSSFEDAQLRVRNESRIDWLGFTTSKPTYGQARKFESHELGNMLYLADERFHVTLDGTPISGTTIFNGEFQFPTAFASSSTYELLIDFTQGLEKLPSTGIVYPEGYLYVFFYFLSNDADVTVEGIYNGGGVIDYSASEKNIATKSELGYKVLRYNILDNAYLTKFRITFATGTGQGWITEVVYTQNRNEGQLEEPFLNKTLDNKLHTKLTFRDKVGDRQNDNGTLGQILMSKVDSVEWADFSDIPGIYTYITNISDSVATTADTDTDEQYFDSIAIVDDTLNVSIIRDGVPVIRIDLKPYLDDTDTDDQYFDVINITDDTLNLSIFDDGLPTHRLDLKPYLDLEENTDIQYIDTLYFDMDTLYISLIRDGVPPQKVYLGDLISIADSDKQRHDSAFIQNDTIYLSLQRDSINAHRLDLKPYLDDTDDQTVDQFDIVSDILSISLEDDGEAAHTVDLSPYLDNTDDQKIDVFTFVGTTLSVSNEDDGEASKTVDLSSLVDNWLLNGMDDAFGSTDIGDAETVTFDGTGGITAKLSFDGSNTMVIDGTGLQWILQAQVGTSQIIGDAATEIVEFVGAGNASTSISGNTVTITVPADVDNYVDGATYSGATADLTLTRTGALGDLVVNIMDHDWYEVGTTRPPDAITDEMFHTGKTGIGMNPIWLLDVAEDARINGHQVGRGGGNIQTNLRVGYIALQDNTTGFDNTAIGAYALENNIDGSESVAVGAQAMQDITTGSGNVAIGNFAMGSATGGNYNVAIGYGAFERNTTGVSNNAVGFGTLAYNTTGNYNTAFGDGTMIAHKSGTGNVAIGASVLKRDTVGILNVAMGQYALERMVNVVAKSSYNTSIGTYAGRNMYGIENVALGIGSMRGDTVGAGPEMNYTIALGAYAAHSVIGLQEKNIAIGYNSMGSTPGATHHNIAIGELALNENDGDYNVVIGAVGGGSGLETGDYNTIIGSGITFSANDDSLAVLANGLGTAAIWMKGSGNTGMGTSSPTQRLHVAGSARVTGAYYDSNNEPGTAGQVLSSLATGTDWVDATSGGTMSYFFINGNDDAFGNTQVDQGEVITIDGTGGITASLAASGSLSYVIDGSGITGTTNLSITNATNPGLNSSNGSDVIFQDGTGIDAVYVNDFTIRFNATDASITNEIQSLSFGYGAGQSAITISGDPSTLYMYSGTGITFSGQTGTTMTINANDVAANNEGFNGVGTGGPTSSTITTNTTGGNAITLNVAGTLSISEVANANGGTITITGTGGAGTVTSVGLTGTTGIGVTGSPITTSGTFALSLNNDLAALEALSGTGIGYRTGAATWTNYDFNSLPTGFSAYRSLFVGADGTPETSVNIFVSGSGNSVLNAGKFVSGTGIDALSGTIQSQNLVVTTQVYFDSLPVYASDAAAASLTSGRVYRTSGGELRIKL